MRINSIDMEVREKNIKCLEEAKKEIYKSIDLFTDLYSACIRSSMISEIDKRIESLRGDLLLVDKLIRKANGYKHITVEEDGDYDSTKVTITFPVGTTKKFKRWWMLNNDYPLQTTHYPIYCEYDCSGKLHVIYVDYIRNKVVLSYHYDL